MYDGIDVRINEMEDAKKKILDSKDIIENCVSIMNSANSKLGEFSSNLSSEINSVNNIKKIIDSMISYYNYAIYSYENAYNDNIDLVFNNIFSYDAFEYFPETDFSKLDGIGFGCYQNAAYLMYLQYCKDPDSFNSEVPLEICSDIEEEFAKKGVTDQNEILYCLKVSGKTGCGYASITNIITDYYDNKEGGAEEFEDTYGFPLYYYDENGNKRINYETTFMHIILKSARLNTDELANQMNSDMSDGEVNASISLNPNNADNVFYECFPHASDYERIEDALSVESYEQIMSEGYDYASINVRNFTLKPYGSNKEVDEHHTDGGHWMSIVGVSENGNFIVSSWGMEWELVDWVPSNGNGISFFKAGE